MLGGIDWAEVFFWITLAAVVLVIVRLAWRRD